MTKVKPKSLVWSVSLSHSAGKKSKKLPEKILDLLSRLSADIEQLGPFQKEWPHFGGLEKSKFIPENAYHCHLKRGKPTYVACWRIVSKTLKKVEIFYVGTHENAPY